MNRNNNNHTVKTRTIEASVVCVSYTNAFVRARRLDAWICILVVCVFILGDDVQIAALFVVTHH